MRERPPGRRRWMPRPTVRLRLTLLYGSLFLVAGALLLGITYGLASQHGTGSAERVVPAAVCKRQRGAGARRCRVPAVDGQGRGRRRDSPLALPVQASGAVPSQLSQAVKGLQRFATAQARVDQSSQLSSLLVESAIALAIMSIVSILLGWLVAGRVLAPVRTMNTRMRQISEHNLHERLALGGRDDELKELGETFDELLGRLREGIRVTAAIRRQRLARAAHAGHGRARARRGGAGRSGATVDSLRETCGRVLVAGEQQERTDRGAADAGAEPARSAAPRGRRSRRGRRRGARRVERRKRAGALEGRFEPSAVSGDPGAARAAGREPGRQRGPPQRAGRVGSRQHGGPRRRARDARGGQRPPVPAENRPAARAIPAAERGPDQSRRRRRPRAVDRGAIATAHGADLALVARPEGGST